MDPKATDARIDTIFAERYKVLDLLGKGGMSVVYKAKHLMMDRVVALKLLRSHLVSDDTTLLRFQQEARAASSLSHPNIVAVHDFGRTKDGTAYLVMDYIVGKTLSEVIREEGPIPVDRCLRIFDQVLDALEHAHKNGVIHRDIKSSNIMLVEEDGKPDSVRLVDFGVAKLMDVKGGPFQELTQTGELVGSPVYMSPEQCRGGQLDPRSDLYSVGCAMYEALTGEVPLVGANIFETLLKHDKETPRNLREVNPTLEVPKEVEIAILHALEKEPEQRPSSAAALKAELRQPPTGLDLAKRRAVKAVYMLRKPHVFVPLCLAFALVIAATALTVHYLNRDDSFKQETWRLASDKGERAMDEHDYKAAVQAFSDAADQAKKSADPKTLIASLNSLSNAYSKLNDKESEGETLYRLGDLYLFQDSYSQAEDAFERSFDLLSAADPQSHAALASLDKLGFALAREESFDDADEKLNQAFEKRQQLFGSGSADAASSLSHLATLQLLRMDDRDTCNKAEEKYRAAQAIFDKQGDSFDSAENLSDWSKKLFRCEQFDEARAKAERALAMRVKLGGEEHPLVLSSKVELGEIAVAQGHYQDGIRLYEEAISTISKFYGYDNPWVAMAYNSLGVAYLKNNQLADAQKALNHSLSIRNRVLGTDHALVAETLRNLGELSLKEKQYSTAMEYYNQALGIDRLACGHYSSMAAEDLSGQGKVYLAMNEPSKALTCLSEAARICKERLGLLNPVTERISTEYSQAALSMPAAEKAATSSSR